MNKIIINPHYCSKEEYQDLKDYLTEKAWDWQEVSSGEPENQKKRVVEILQHEVEYWFINDEKYLDGICLTDCDEEHIKKMIEEGYNQGELCSLVDAETEERGWWKIIKD